MQASDRRSEIMNIFKNAKAPVSATTLAERLHVSRQVIVGDVALLRASGVNIAATAKGYLLGSAEGGISRTIAVSHTKEDTQKELYAIVDCGCCAVDVIVEHPVYGQITCALQLSSRYDVDLFISRMREPGAMPLSSLTEGLHLHTVSAPNEQRFSHLLKTLSEYGILVTD